MERPSPPPEPSRRTLLLDLRQARDKATFLERCAVHLGLPEWFGHNWDALADSLQDTAWWDGDDSRVLRVVGWPGFRAAAPRDAAMAADVLAEAVAYWDARGRRLAVRFDDPALPR